MQGNWYRYADAIENIIFILYNLSHFGRYRNITKYNNSILANRWHFKVTNILNFKQNILLKQAKLYLIHNKKFFNEVFFSYFSHCFIIHLSHIVTRTCMYDSHIVRRSQEVSQNLELTQILNRWGTTCIRHLRNKYYDCKNLLVFIRLRYQQNIIQWVGNHDFGQIDNITKQINYVISFNQKNTART